MEKTKISHIGIAVKDLTASKKLFGTLFKVEHFHEETVEDQKVRIASFPVGESVIELTEATSEDSPIAKFIAKRGEGIHHVAFEVGDIASELSRLSGEGFTLLSEEATKGAHDMLVAFLHPKSTNGVLVELCQHEPSK
ncbi:MAG TPA: methylmalonyl-CoA epimerase [Candidatus Kapabacteria bacterium]|nr:methylmalonyl-CoA epimerase [Candidatus Kapabacteria bacterium]